MALAGGGSALAAAIAEAVVAWPNVQLAAEQFAAHLVARLPGDRPPETGLRSLRLSDLYLACACMYRDANALVAFERDYLTVVDRALPRMGLDADAVNEVKQRMRYALLVSDGGLPGIAKFSGRGDLRRWLRVLAVREAIGAWRTARQQVATEEDRLIDLVAAPGGPELEYFRRMYRCELEVALRDAIRTLSDRERTLIRQHFLDGLDIVELGRVYRVHRATAGRWLEDARVALLAATRAYMSERLGVTPADLDSILRLVLSRLELDLRPLFRRRSCGRG
jgi:RNA polymerase sigma-70 factor (ECF subfamily)